MSKNKPASKKTSSKPASTITPQKKGAESAVTPTAPTEGATPPEEQATPPAPPATPEEQETPAATPATPEEEEAPAPELTEDQEKAPEPDYEELEADSEELKDLQARLSTAYDYVPHFFLSDDMQVFLPENKQYAKDHQKSIGGGKIKRLARA